MPNKAQNDRAVIVDVQELSKSFEHTPLFDSISFKIYRGSFTTILGLNGVGKSTLLNILCNRMAPDHAVGEVLDMPIGSDLGLRREDIGLVSEHLNYEIGSSAREFAHYYGKLFTKFDEEKLINYCEHRRLDLGKHFSQFSRGQKMQFCLVLAMAQNPKVLFIDEITSVLDYKAREFFLSELRSFCEQGGTVVLTTNIINEVQQYSTDLVIIQNSKEVVSGPQEEILDQFIKIRFDDSTALPSVLREAALYLGKDQEKGHLMVLSKDLWEKYLSEELKAVELMHPSLHEVFSLLTQQS